MSGAVKKGMLWAEFVLLFFLAPYYYAFHHESSPLLFLFLLGLSGFLILYKNNSFRNHFFLNKQGWTKDIPRVLWVFILVATVLIGLTYLFSPDFLFYCPINHFSLWLSLMVIYPLLSVYPQELIYRAFLFHRYRPLLQKERSLIHLSAIAFSFGHIIYFHPISIILTFFGGYLFAWTYAKTQSLLAVSFEHALYGCLLYTIGLGRFFYTGFDKLLH
ncbi:CPBP family intramembrane glutamic endopeptidase [uncultured Desulfuromusa sp.]|uniref:CPBP family intramembrane glutamic endopeptidase n=1 Tax=uncultured Desulfuromusa sp. TaxID=219183 RepID=UPI002AA7EDD0|nr:CPBP family intramembrane glutamic endopeptidase [uncultured Desulfuromusa sp.]